MKESALTRAILEELMVKDDEQRCWAAYATYWSRCDREDKAEFLDEVASLRRQCEAEGFPLSPPSAWALCVMACAHHKICEDHCNRDITESEEALRDTIEAGMAQMFEGSGIKTGSQYDPRGLTLKLFLPSGRYNNWDGESWRIPMPC